MHPNAMLAHATELLQRVLALQHPADAVVADYVREQRSLGPRERRTLADTVYAVLRRRPLLQHLAQSGQGAMARRLAILGWQGDAGFLRAALDDAERDWLAQVDRIDRTALPERLRHNLPEWLAAELQATLGEEFWALIESLETPAPLDLRVNTLKARRDAVQQALADAGIVAAPTPYAPHGLRLEGKPALQRLDAYTSGAIEVQDEGSQLVTLLVEARRGEMVADFCAGGGGKTLALGAAMRNTGRLYAFDTSGHRLAAIKPRLARSSLSNVYPAQIAHERDERIKRLAGKMDRVLVDAPCSGLGTLRRNPDLKWRQTPQTIAELQQRQIAILAGAARLVKPGGRLVYATCSLLEAENEAVARAFGAAQADFDVLPAADVLERAKAATPERLVQGEYLRLWPQRHGSDGFFAALWQRR